MFLADDYQVTQFSQCRVAHGVKSTFGAQGLTLHMLCTVYSALEAFQCMPLALLSLFLYHAHPVLEITHSALILVLMNDRRLEEVDFYCTWLM